ncbi:MAG TPA: methyltransferase domain-containing protein [Gemmatimonadaceae bacterium]|nr:methyltransferase domain-containing protein [Gemmatimonadaceae bacterium]
MRATDFSYSGTELDALAAAPNYYRFIARRFAPFVGSRSIEVGAGIGTFAEHLRRETSLRELVMVEPADNNFPQLERRVADWPNARAVHGYLEEFVDTITGMDSLVAVNVLEHTPDDVSFLRAARRVLRPGGAALVFVPAVQAVYGSLDTEFEHYRRYGKAMLRRSFVEAGFHDVRLRHVNSLGLAAWFMAGRVFKWRTIDASRVRFYDRWVVPWLTRVESAVEPPIGQSILGIAFA